MKNGLLISKAIINSLGIAVYIILVTLIMQNGQRFFGNMNEIIGISAFLLLFVLSAAVVGSLILSKPIMLYIDGQKKEAVKLLIYTILILFVFTLISFLILLIIK